MLASYSTLVTHTPEGDFFVCYVQLLHLLIVNKIAASLGTITPLSFRRQFPLFLLQIYHDGVVSSSSLCMTDTKST